MLRAGLVNGVEYTFWDLCSGVAAFIGIHSSYQVSFGAELLSLVMCVASRPNVISFSVTESASVLINKEGDLTILVWLGLD